MPIKSNLVTEYFIHFLYFKAYEANRDSVFLKTQNTSFYARFVRIIPTEWHDAICMKVQLKGCPGLHFLSYSIHGKRYNWASMILFIYLFLVSRKMAQPRLIDTLISCVRVHLSAQLNFWVKVLHYYYTRSLVQCVTDRTIRMLDWYRS